ncbi:MAG: flagellar biosynthesis protein FlgD [Rhodospirillaceae bacterium]|nr:flagellar biosynthesis protein FlgD [Rhodospirillaceae bacterium]|tara:strand:+ start:2421 stop:3089 length:669 start_codon:yes stop_codon:yes gene_type:complete
MEIIQTTPAVNQPKGDSATALKGLGEDLNTFLTMLTTQLKNQDPTNPLDTNEMTAQLVQFANVEQQIAQNKNLEDLVRLQSSNAEFGAVNFIGRHLQVEGDTTSVGSEGTTWGYLLDTAATSVDLHVVDASGLRIYSQEGETTAGVRHEFRWDATDNNGDPIDPGQYKLLVISRDAQGQIMDGKPTIDSTGLVMGVKSNKTGPSLLLGEDIEVTLSEVMKIK